MDAPNPSANIFLSEPTFASRTPVHVGAVALYVRDLDKLAAYYKTLLGLGEIERAGDTLRLGAGGVPFLELIHRPGMLPDDPRSAGLYHTAFLMPTRADLARWILHVMRNRIPVTGASDHSVSEAIYLDDPEGNGVEVYADRPPTTWLWENGQVVMNTDPLDIGAILREVAPDEPYPGAPGGLRIGHVHLRAGNVDEAERFYTGTFGFDVTRRRMGASFMSSAQYHHHVAANVWQSNGAGPRDDKRAGLAWFSLEADAPAYAAVRARLAAKGTAFTENAAGLEFADPWGTRIRVVKTPV